MVPALVAAAVVGLVGMGLGVGLDPQFWAGRNAPTGAARSAAEVEGSLGGPWVTIWR